MSTLPLFVVVVKTIQLSAGSIKKNSFHKRIWMKLGCYEYEMDLENIPVTVHNTLNGHDAPSKHFVSPSAFESSSRPRLITSSSRQSDEQSSASVPVHWHWQFSHCINDE